MTKSLGFFLGALFGAILAAALDMRAQEKPMHQTRQWEVMAINDGYDYPQVRINVVDTEGVCIYITRAYDGKASISMSTVPKTQLPKGAGCQ